MPTATFHSQTEQQRLAIEAAISFVAEMHSLAQSAPTGQVLSACEAMALDQGRALRRSTSQTTVQAAIDQAEKKGGPHACAARALAPSAANAPPVPATC